MSAICPPGWIFPQQMFREEEASGAPGSGDKSLPPQARAEDFLLKFKRKTGFHSAPKNVFPGGQWAPFCASEVQRGGRSGDLSAPAAPDRLAPPSTGEPGTRGSPCERPTEARCPGLGAPAVTQVSCGPGRGAWGAPHPVPLVSGPCPKGRALLPRVEVGRLSGLGPRRSFSPRSSQRRATSTSHRAGGRGTLS